MNEENSKNKYISPLAPAHSQLDLVLDKLENVGIKTSPNLVEKRIFMQKGDSPKPKKDFFKDLGWYLAIVKNWVLFLALMNILVYILAMIDSLKYLMFEIINPLLLLFDFIIFGLLVFHVKRRKKENYWQAVVTCFMAGFGTGLVTSIFKVFWIHQFWTIFNLIIEPVLMGLSAAIVGFVVGLFIKRKKI